jgi:hypothetical protein
VGKERTDCPVLAALACTIASVERRGARDRRFYVVSRCFRWCWQTSDGPPGEGGLLLGQGGAVGCAVVGPKPANQLDNDAYPTPLAGNDSTPRTPPLASIAATTWLSRCVSTPPSPARALYHGHCHPYLSQTVPGLGGTHVPGRRLCRASCWRSWLGHPPERGVPRSSPTARSSTSRPVKVANSRISCARAIGLVVPLARWVAIMVLPLGARAKRGALPRQSMLEATAPLAVESTVTEHGPAPMSVGS